VKDVPHEQRTRASIHRWIMSPFEDTSLELADFVTILKASIGIADETWIVERLTDVADFLEASHVPLNGCETIASIFEIVDSMQATEVDVRIRSLVVDEWRVSLKEEVKESGTLSSYYHAAEKPAAQQALREFVTGQLAEFGVELTEDETLRICSVIDLSEIMEENMDIAARDDEQSDRWREERAEALDEMGAVDDLFEREAR
jgi:post-segregation antitoxin (ccd killing protein)